MASLTFLTVNAGPSLETLTDETIATFAATSATILTWVAFTWTGRCYNKHSDILILGTFGCHII